MYYFLQAVNHVGESEGSPPSVERTREDVPSQGPGGIRAEATTSTTVVVRWLPVAPPHQNGLIMGYKVRPPA